MTHEDTLGKQKAEFPQLWRKNIRLTIEAILAALLLLCLGLYLWVAEGNFAIGVILIGMAVLPCWLAWRGVSAAISLRRWKRKVDTIGTTKEGD